MRIAISILTGLAVLTSAGCVSVWETRSVAGAGACQIGEPMVETMLFLGLASPGGTVSRFEFSQFLEAEVVPRWKEGFTIVEGNGLWLSEERRITERESSRILIRFHDGSPAASSDIEAIRNAYIKAFQQDAVLRTDRPTCADF